MKDYPVLRPDDEIEADTMRDLVNEAAWQFHPDGGHVWDEAEHWMAIQTRERIFGYDDDVRLLIFRIGDVFGVRVKAPAEDVAGEG